MPYVLSSILSPQAPAHWGEGSPYERSAIYDGCGPDPKRPGPPVRYDSHLLKPHSLPHADAPAHILPEGKTIEAYFQNLGPTSALWGPCVVLHFEGADFVSVPASEGVPAHCLQRVSLAALQKALVRVTGVSECPTRLLITAPGVPMGGGLSHDPSWVLVLDTDAARWIAQSGRLAVYGTSWKSTDFTPRSRERPIHTALFQSALIYECLHLRHVPEGTYLWVGPPLPLEGASESPACPMLFTWDELRGVL